MRNYFLHNGKEQKGPFDLDNIKKQKITKDTMIWYEGLDNWVEAESIPELKEMFLSTPPPYIKPNILSSTKNIPSVKENNNSTWICKNCQESVDEEYDTCWNCGADKDGNISEDEENKFKELKNDIESSDGSSLIAIIVIIFAFSFIGFILGYLIFGNIMGNYISLDKIFSSNSFSSLVFSNIREKIIIFTIVGGIIGIFFSIKKNKNIS